MSNQPAAACPLQGAAAKPQRFQVDGGSEEEAERKRRVAGAIGASPRPQPDQDTAPVATSWSSAAVHPPPHTPEPELSPGGSSWRERVSVPLRLLF